MRKPNSPRRKRAGSALVELALITPVLMLTIIGMVDLSRAYYASIEVNNAALAGAEYGARVSTNSTDLAGMQNTAKLDAADVLSISATAHRRVCTDTSGTPSACQTCDTLTQTCTVAAPWAVFVDVTTTATVPMLFSWPGLSLGTITLTGKAHVRAQ